MSPIPLGILAASGGGAQPAFDLLETQVLSSAASSVTFTGLGAYTDYQHLQVRISARTTQSTASNNFMRLNINGDSASNYNGHYMQFTIGGSQQEALMSQSFISLPKMNAEFPSTNIYTPSIIDITDFSNANKFTTVRAVGGIGHAGDGNLNFMSGLWRNTNAVTQLQFISPSNSFATSSRFSLYGAK